MNELSTRQIFAQMLVKLRKDRGISRKKLADDIGVSSASIGYYENADRAPDIEILVKIADYFSVTCDELVRGVKSPDKNIYKDLWLSDRALGNLRKLKQKKPINSSSKISFLFEFFNEFLENDLFIDFVDAYYQYAIGFDANHVLCLLNDEASEIFKELICTRDVGECSYYGDFMLFRAVQTLQYIARLFQYRDLRDYEDYRINKLEKKLNKIKENKSNGKHNPPKE